MRWLLRRRWLWLLVFVSAALSVAVFLAYVSTDTKITRENIERIKEGMTLEEVEAILGGPPRIEGTNPSLNEGQREVRELYSRKGLDFSLPGFEFRDTVRGWDSRRAAVVIHFRAETAKDVDKVLSVLPDRTSHPTLEERFSLWLHRLLH
jgi:hypothetical protein